MNINIANSMLRRSTRAAPILVAFFLLVPSLASSQSFPSSPGATQVDYGMPVPDLRGRVNRTTSSRRNDQASFGRFYGTPSNSVILAGGALHYSARSDTARSMPRPYHQLGSNVEPHYLRPKKKQRFDKTPLPAGTRLYRTCLNIGLVLSQLDSVRRCLRPKLITAPRVLAKCFLWLRA